MWYSIGSGDPSTLSAWNAPRNANRVLHLLFAAGIERGPESRFHKGDLTDTTLLERIMQGVDVVCIRCVTLTLTVCHSAYS